MTEAKNVGLMMTEKQHDHEDTSVKLQETVE